MGTFKYKITFDVTDTQMKKQKLTIEPEYNGFEARPKLETDNHIYYFDYLNSVQDFFNELRYLYKKKKEVEKSVFTENESGTFCEFIFGINGEQEIYIGFENDQSYFINDKVLEDIIKQLTKAMKAWESAFDDASQF